MTIRKLLFTPIMIFCLIFYYTSPLFAADGDLNTDTDNRVGNQNNNEREEPEEPEEPEESK